MKFDSWQFDDLDLVRALLSALSWREPETLTPVSAVSIHHELVRRNRNISAANALATLSRIGDAQQLEHGYWLPCPTHGATDGDIVVIVSCEPTDALATSHGSSIRRGEFGRYFTAANELKTTISTVSLAAWLQIPSSSVEWLKDYLESAAFAPPVALDEVEVYRHWPARNPRRWLPLPEALGSGERHLLARIGPLGLRRYLFLRSARHALKDFHELPPGFDTPRAMCALQQTAADPIIAAFKKSESGAGLTMTSPIVPDRERVFLQCVGTIHSRSNSSKIDVELPSEALAAVHRIFSALGCNVQETRA